MELQHKFRKPYHVSTHHNKPQILITTYCYKTEHELFCEDNSKSLTTTQTNKLTITAHQTLD